MLQVRVIPCLLLQDQGLVKTIRFRKSTYVGDPINTLKLFNDKEVDEIIFLDINASKKKIRPNFEMISQIASECFMPLCYGGGIRSMKDISTILNLGVEKVSLNNYILENPSIISQASDKFGSQSIVVTIDVKKTMFGVQKVYNHVRKSILKLNPVEFALKLEKAGAGELLINSVDRDGTMLGYDIDLLKDIRNSVKIPVIACGGAGNYEHLSQAFKKSGVSAVAAGSMFVFQGRHRAVLINYLSHSQIKSLNE